MILDPAFYKEPKSAFAVFIQIWMDIAARQDKRPIFFNESEAQT